MRILSSSCRVARPRIVRYSSTPEFSSVHVSSRAHSKNFRLFSCVQFAGCGSGCERGWRRPCCGLRVLAGCPAGGRRPTIGVGRIGLGAGRVGWRSCVTNPGLGFDLDDHGAGRSGCPLVQRSGGVAVIRGRCSARRACGGAGGMSGHSGWPVEERTAVHRFGVRMASAWCFPATVAGLARRAR
jgi:hypothetical protein